MTDSADFDSVAGSLRADARDLQTFVEVLAAKLEGALPQQTHIVRRPTRLFSKRRRVERISVDLGDERLLLERTTGGVETRHAKTVRGIVLKNELLPLEAWIDLLARAITDTANVSERGRLALERLLDAGDS